MNSYLMTELLKPHLFAEIWESLLIVICLVIIFIVIRLFYKRYKIRHSK